MTMESMDDFGDAVSYATINGVNPSCNARPDPEKVLRVMREFRERSRRAEAHAEVRRVWIPWSNFGFAFTASELQGVISGSWMPDFINDYDRWFVASLLRHGGRLGLIQTVYLVRRPDPHAMLPRTPFWSDLNA